MKAVPFAAVMEWPIIVNLLSGSLVGAWLGADIATRLQARSVSLPTMLVGFARYSRDQSFAVLARHKRFLLSMAAGSFVGAFVGGQLLGFVPDRVLLPLLAVILIASAVKVWRH